MTENTVKAELFRRELAELLKKYDAEITAEDHNTGYAECNIDDIKIVVDFKGEHINGDYIVHASLDLGNYFDGK